MKIWNDVINCIEQHDDIVIMTHTDMDGDAMGSASALCQALRAFGKRCIVLLEDEVPAYLNVIYREKDDKSIDPIFVDTMPFEASLAIALDCGDESRIAKRIDIYRRAETRVCIDHHLQEGDFAEHSVVNPDMAATGMLIYRLIQALGVKMSRHMAEDLYVAILTDTGRFKYSNTDAEVHRVVAELFGYGIDHVKICNAIYDSHPLPQIKAEGLATKKIELFAEGRAAISFITGEEMEVLGATYDQLDTCIDRIRIIEGVEIAAFLKEKEPGLIKLSLRAKTYANVNRIALALGGGGHEKASGASLHMSFEEAIAKTRAEIEKELERYK